jgi:superfamily II DNA or RNA helicase
MIDLFDDQTEMVEAVAAAMRAGHKSVLLQSATGSGKSVMASALLARARAKNKTAWFDVPRKALMKQMHGTFNHFQIPHSYIASGKSFNPYAAAHICSTETIRRRLDDLKPPDIAIIDETHYGGSGRDSIIKWLESNGVWIVGLSATPWLLNGQGLGKWYSTMIQGKSIRWLIQNKRLADYRPFAPSRIDLSRVKTANGDYVSRDIKSKMEDDQALIGDAVKHYKDNAFGKLGIAYCTSVKHSKMTAERFKSQGVPAAHLDGDTPFGEMQRIIRAYANRELLYLTNCELLTFGFDLASQVNRNVTIEVMTDLRPTKSLALQMQKWGRVLRMKDEPAIIFDHANNFNEHGLPCDDRYWTLQDRVKSSGGVRLRSIPARDCPKCFFCHPPSLECPNCGHLYPVESRTLFEVDGDLEEIEKNKAKKLARMEVGQAKTLDDLRKIREERGYKPQWVNIIAKAKGIKE